jgi:hypothetical protein
MQVGGVAMPQFGVGFGPGGMRIGMGGGDFSPMKLWRAVISGQGFEKPRTVGAIMFGLAFVFAIVNSVLLFVLNWGFPYLYAVACIFWWAGLWLLIAGQPRATPDGRPAPMWSRVILGLCLAFGTLQGLAVVAMSFRSW